MNFSKLLSMKVNNQIMLETMQHTAYPSKGAYLSVFLPKIVCSLKILSRYVLSSIWTAINTIGKEDFDVTYSCNCYLDWDLEDTQPSDVFETETSMVEIIDNFLSVRKTNQNEIKSWYIVLTWNYVL